MPEFKHAYSPFKNHQHSQCIHHALCSAEKLCKENGFRLTNVRKRVLELIWESHQALGAYAILEQLGQEGVKPAPPTVYRALDFLLDAGLVHRINSLNAYIGCNHPKDHHHGSYFLICQHCRIVAEIHDQAIDEEISALAKREAFIVCERALEISGICQRCQENGHAG
ncbi:MAG: transcriptional repressor [Pseudomonadales bacterium]|nr:transcriptional repressor [Pseudomonadales bacterium]